MKIIINADDFGLTNGITDKIIETHEFGCLNRTSLIPNGNGFYYAINKINNYPDLELSIHLNFVEGKSISNPKLLPNLVNKSGYFNKSFQGLFFTYYFSNKKRKMLIEKQIEIEMEAQIKKVFNNSKKEIKRIDSHQHFHLLPFVFKYVLLMMKKYKLNSVRIANEIFYFPDDIFFSLKNIFSTNIIKFFILNILSNKAKKKLQIENLFYNDQFIGALFTGNMTLSSISKALKKLASCSCNNVEILLHPGSANLGEINLWNDNISQANYYFSKWREKESAVLRNIELKKLIREYSK